MGTLGEVRDGDIIEAANTLVKPDDRIRAAVFYKRGHFAIFAELAFIDSSEIVKGSDKFGHPILEQTVLFVSPLGRVTAKSDGTFYRREYRDEDISILPDGDVHNIGSGRLVEVDPEEAATIAFDAIRLIMDENHSEAA